MSFEFVEKAAPERINTVRIPDRLYAATLTGYKIYQRPNRESGEPENRIAWSFLVVTKKGNFEIPGFTSTKWGNADKPSVAREWVAALAGVGVGDRELPTKLDEVIGKAAQVMTMTIGEGEAARSIVKTVLPTGDDIDF